MIGARAQATAGPAASEARQLYEDAARLAELRNLPDVGTSHLAWAMSMELAYGTSNRPRDWRGACSARDPATIRDCARLWCWR